MKYDESNDSEASEIKKRASVYYIPEKSYDGITWEDREKIYDMLKNYQIEEAIEFYRNASGTDINKAKKTIAKYYKLMYKKKIK